MYCPAAHTTPKKRAKNSVFYRLGFNGKLKDNEIYEEGNAYGFEARMYDPRLGRWMSVDPQAGKYPQLSGYSFVGNSPIFFIDPDGERLKPANAASRDVFYNVLSSVLGGISISDAINVFGLKFENKTFSYYDQFNQEQTIVQPVFIVSNERDAVNKFMKQVSKLYKENKITAEQLDEAIGLYNLLADTKTTEFLLLSGGDFSSKHGGVPNATMGTPPNQVKFFSISFSNKFNRLKVMFEESDPNKFNEEIKKADIHNTDIAGGQAAYYNENPQSITGINGVLIIDTRQYVESSYNEESLPQDMVAKMNAAYFKTMGDKFQPQGNKVIQQQNNR